MKVRTKEQVKQVSENRIQENIQKVLDAFKNQKFVNQAALSYIQKQVCEKPSNYWSFGNRLIMRFSGTNDARGFDQWKKVGRYVKKGAKAIHILAPVYKKIRSVKTVENENGETVEEETEINVIAFFKNIPVFRIEDTEGKPVEEPDYRPKNPPRLLEVAQRLGIEVDWLAGDKQEYGSYLLKEKRIILKSHDEKVFFHELAHAVHDIFIEKLQGGQVSHQEIVAEMTAAVICELFGIESYLERSYNYIRQYANANSPNKTIAEIMRVLDKVEKILDVIFNYHKNEPSPKNPKKSNEMEKAVAENATAFYTYHVKVNGSIVIR